MSTPVQPDPYADALRDLLPMDPTEALRRIQTLIQTEPNFRAIEADHSCPPATLKWLGQLHAVLKGMKLTAEIVSLNVASGVLLASQGQSGASDIRAVLYRALAVAELKAPASEQGSFIAAGNELDAYAAISKVLATATQHILVVDPYMDGKALTDFLPSAAEGTSLFVLADHATVKPTLAPAAAKWNVQFAATRPLKVRLAAARSLHDRLIVVDARDVWSLSQSLKDFANRAHGSILKVDPEIAAMKIDAYATIWDSAEPM